jgi:hypothetical protein
MKVIFYSSFVRLCFEVKSMHFDDEDVWADDSEDEWEDDDDDDDW